MGATYLVGIPSAENAGRGTSSIRSTRAILQVSSDIQVYIALLLTDKIVIQDVFNILSKG